MKSALTARNCGKCRARKVSKGDNLGRAEADAVQVPRERRESVPPVDAAARHEQRERRREPSGRRRRRGCGDAPGNIPRVIRA